MSSLPKWVEANTVNPEMLWKGAALHQFDQWNECLEAFRAHDRGVTAHVVSTHTSKSILLPVVQFRFLEKDATLTGRHNFYDWSFTATASKPFGAFNHEGFRFGGHHVYYEGFERGGIQVYAYTPEPGVHASFSFKLGRPLPALLRVVEAMP